MAPLKLNQIRPFLNQPTSQLTAKNQSRRENQAATNQLQHLQHPQPARSQIQPSKSVSPKKPKLTPTSTTPRSPSSEPTQRFLSPFI